MYMFTVYVGYLLVVGMLRASMIMRAIPAVVPLPVGSPWLGRSIVRSQTKVQTVLVLEVCGYARSQFSTPHSSTRAKGALGLASQMYLKPSQAKNKSGRNTSIMSRVRDKPAKDVSPGDAVKQSKSRGRCLTNTGKSR